MELVLFFVYLSMAYTYTPSGFHSDCMYGASSRLHTAKHEHEVASHTDRPATLEPSLAKAPHDMKTHLQ